MSDTAVMPKYACRGREDILFLVRFPCVLVFCVGPVFGFDIKPQDFSSTLLTLWIRRTGFFCLALPAILCLATGPRTAASSALGRIGPDEETQGS